MLIIFIHWIINQPGESGVFITQFNTSPHNGHSSNTKNIATMKSIQLLSTAFVLSQTCDSASARSLLRGDVDIPGEKSSSSIDVERDLFETRIIGGTEAVEDRHPYAVSLQDGYGRHFCGGSLIAKDVILTAAHCQVENSYTVVLSRHDRDQVNDGEVMEIREDGSLPHPEYDSFSTDNDFMLVFLKSAPANDDNLKLVTLNSNPMVPAKGQEVTVMGWGDMDIRDDWTELSDVLRSVDITVISNVECDASEGAIGGWFETYEGQITDNMLCARARKQDACQGDSGGPLVIKGGDSDGESDVQVAVVSWGIGCANRNFPGVYARVSRAYDWIEAEVCMRSVFAAEAGFDCGAHWSSSNNGNDGSNAENFASAVGAYSRSRNNGSAGSHAENFARGNGNRDLHGEGNIADEVLVFISSLLGGGNRS